VPAKFNVDGKDIDVNVAEALCILTKEQIFSAACSMPTTEIHWLSVMLGRVLSGDYTRERN